jgi:hypothetical protein
MIKIEEGIHKIYIGLFSYDLLVVKCEPGDVQERIESVIGDVCSKIHIYKESDGTFYPGLKCIWINTRGTYKNYAQAVNVVSHEAVHAGFGLVAHIAGNMYPQDYIGEEVVAYTTGTIVSEIISNLVVHDA